VPPVDHSAVSVLVVAYDNGPALLRCLESALSDGCDELLLVNNGRPGPEIEQARAFPRVRLVPTEGNLGFGGAGNRAAAEARGDVLVFLNPDTEVEPGAIGALADLACEPDVGIASARLRLQRDPERLNSAGGAVHLCGLGWATRLGAPADTITDVQDIAAASGAAMAMRREVFEALGGFREEFFLYQEDLELSWRVHLHGLRVLITPKADVRHDYEFGRNPGKFALIERNRLQFVLTAYSRRLLVLLAPALVSYEVGVTVHAARHGWLRGKVRGWVWCWRHRDLLRRRRAETAALRRVSDAELAPFFSTAIEDTPIPLPRSTRCANALLGWYWRRVGRWL
jgi:GT2 family glycosyltransferase